MQRLTELDELFNRIDTMSDEDKEAYDKAIADRIAEANRLEKERVFLATGVPNANAHCSFDNYDSGFHADCHKAWLAVSEFVHSPGRHRLLVLIGSNGTGKTHLAASAIRVLGGMYRQSFDICAEYEDAGNFRAEWNKTGLIKRYVSAWFLAIDEVGRATDAKSEAVVLSKIITGRIEAGKRTIIISNSTFEELRSRCLDNATVDRMNVYGVVVQLTGKSYRLEQAKEAEK